jgi:hypothetical protein
VTAMLPELERKLREGEITSYKHAA